MTINFRVAAAQLSPIFLNKEKTVEKVCEAILDAVGHYSRPDVFNFNLNKPNKN